MNNNRGFTLIETLIYAALTTAMIAFAILSVYQLIAAKDRNKHQKELTENQKILEQKIFWALQSVSAINSPSVDATSTILSVDKLNFADNPVVIDLDGGSARLKRGSNPAQLITNDYSEVSDLSFHQYSLSGRPAIQINATLINSYSSTSVEINTTLLVK